MPLQGRQYSRNWEEISKWFSCQSRDDQYSLRTALHKSACVYAQKGWCRFFRNCSDVNPASRRFERNKDERVSFELSGRMCAGGADAPLSGAVSDAFCQADLSALDLSSKLSHHAAGAFLRDSSCAVMRPVISAHLLVQLQTARESILFWSLLPELLARSLVGGGITVSELFMCESDFMLYAFQRENSKALQKQGLYLLWKSVIDSDWSSPSHYQRLYFIWWNHALHMKEPFYKSKKPHQAVGHNTLSCYKILFNTLLLFFFFFFKEHWTLLTSIVRTQNQLDIS